MALRLPAVAAAVVIAGCGSASRPATTPARNPCPPGPGGRGRVVAREFELLRCRYPGARVTIDTAPQAFVRWDREQVELVQNTAGGWRQDPQRHPRTVKHLGEGAFWVPIEHRLVATDGRSIVTVVVGGSDATSSRATTIARAVLASRR